MLLLSGTAIEKQISGGVGVVGVVVVGGDVDDDDDDDDGDKDDDDDLMIRKTYDFSRGHF